jgi:hypothetical protein
VGEAVAEGVASTTGMVLVGGDAGRESHLHASAPIPATAALKNSRRVSFAIIYLLAYPEATSKPLVFEMASCIYYTDFQGDCQVIFVMIIKVIMTLPVFNLSG